MLRGVLLLLGAFATVSSADACRANAGRAQATDATTWQIPVQINSRWPALVAIEYQELGTDTVLSVLSAGTAVRNADLPPTRYALERTVLLAFSGQTSTLQLRSGAKFANPTLRLQCLSILEPEFWAALWLASAAELTYQAEQVTQTRMQSELRTRALASLDLIPKASTGLPHPMRASALHLAGLLYSRTGKFATAFASYQSAERAWTEAGLPAQAAAARFYAAQAQTHAGQARAALATLQPLLEPAVALRWPVINGWARNDACMAFRELNALAQAEICFARLAKSLQKIGEFKDAGNALCNRASVLGSAGNWHKAEPILRSCLSERLKLGTDSGVAHAQLLVGWWALETGNTSEAVKRFRRSLRAAKRSGEASRIWDARRWLAQAWIDSDELPRARDALSRFSIDSKQDPGGYGEWLAALGYLDFLQEDFPAARQKLGEAARRQEQLNNVLALSRVRCVLGLLPEQLDDSANCSVLRVAAQMLRRGAFARVAQTLREPRVFRQEELLRQILLSSARFEQTGVKPLAELDRLLTQALALVAKTARAQVERGQLLAEIGLVLCELSWREKDPEIAALAARALLGAGGRHRASAVSLIKRQVSPLLEGIEGQPLTLRIPPHEVRLVSASGSGNTYLIALRASGAAQLIKADSLAIQRAAAAWHSSTQRGDYAQAAAGLSQALKIEQWLHPQDRKLVLSVHGGLSELPWSALAIGGVPVTRLGYRPLVLQLAIEHRIASEQANRPLGRSKTLFILGTESAPGLPGVDAETAHVEALFSLAGWQTARLVPSTLGKLADGRILHIGGHARADPVHARGGTIFLPRNGRWESVELPPGLFSRSELVVLGGCETASGAHSVWRSNYSLGARIVSWGAAASVAHLWPIADMAASRLHRDMYQQLLVRFDPAHAVAVAQRTRIASRADWRPVHWASAVVYRAEHTMLAPGERNPLLARQDSTEPR